MTYTKLLIPAKQAEATQSAQYTVSSGSKIVIDKFTATNTNTVPVTISVNLVVNGGSIGDGNLITKARNIAPGETYTFPELIGQVVETEGYISTIASVASSITITASGREIVE